MLSMIRIRHELSILPIGIYTDQSNPRSIGMLMRSTHPTGQPQTACIQSSPSPLSAKLLVVNQRQLSMYNSESKLDVLGEQPTQDQ